MNAKLDTVIKLDSISYLICYTEDGEEKEAFCDCIEELMCVVLSEKEWDDWLDGKGFPLVDGEKINDEVEFAKRRLKAIEEETGSIFGD